MANASAQLELSIRLSEVIGSGPWRGVVSSDILGVNRPFSKTLKNGTGAGQVDLVYTRSHTIAASGSLSLDLAGSLTDPEGTAITFATIKGIAVINTNTAGTLSITEPASNAVSGLLEGGSGGGVRCHAAASADEPGIVLITIPGALTITAGTGDIITITNNDASNAATIYLAIWGISA